MKNIFSKLSLNTLFAGRTIATIYVVALCTGLSSKPFTWESIPVAAAALMALSPFVFFFRIPVITKAFWWGLAYWGVCYFTALFNGDMRFSTLGFLALYIMTFVVFYNLIYQHAFTLDYFTKLLRWLIIAYGVTLIIQQIAVLLGLQPLDIINLPSTRQWISLEKLPSLTYEPSHSARLLTVMMLGYMRCWEIRLGGQRISLPFLFSKEQRPVTLLFFWAMLTMGSGTAFIGLGLLGLYFIRWNTTAIYVLPILALLFYAGQQMELKNMERAKKISMAVMEGGNTQQLRDADGSAATRVIPMVNTIILADLTSKEYWFGKGTMSKERTQNFWKRDNEKLAVVEQYGLLGLIANFIFIFTCVIRKFWSIETLILIVLFSFSLANMYYTWGAIMIFATISKLYGLSLD